MSLTLQRAKVSMLDDQATVPGLEVQTGLISYSIRFHPGSDAQRVSSFAFAFSLSCWILLQNTNKTKESSLMCKSFTRYSHRRKSSSALSLSLTFFPFFNSPSLRLRFCDNGAIQMLWKGRRKRSGKLAVSAESEAALHLPARSRVSHSPLLVWEQVLSHSFVFLEIICVVAAGSLLSAVIQIFHEKHMRSNGCTSHNLVYIRISVFPVCPRLTCVSVSSSDWLMSHLCLVGSAPPPGIYDTPPSHQGCLFQVLTLSLPSGPNSVCRSERPDFVF